MIFWLLIFYYVIHILLRNLLTLVLCMFIMYFIFFCGMCTSLNRLNFIVTHNRTCVSVQSTKLSWNCTCTLKDIFSHYLYLFILYTSFTCLLIAFQDQCNSIYYNLFYTITTANTELHSALIRHSTPPHFITSLTNSRYRKKECMWDLHFILSVNLSPSITTLSQSPLSSMFIDII